MRHSVAGIQLTSSSSSMASMVSAEPMSRPQRGYSTQNAGISEKQHKNCCLVDDVPQRTPDRPSGVKTMPFYDEVEIENEKTE